MKITLKHYTTQKEAIKKLAQKAEEIIERAEREFPWVTIIDPKKEWDGNIAHFSFIVKKMFLTLHFSGTIIVTNQEVIGEGKLPEIVTTYFSEKTIRGKITEEFNKLFNIN